MKTKKIILVVLLVLIFFAGIFVLAISGKSENNSDKKQIVVTNFATYDFVRKIVGESDEFEITFLLEPGMDSHGYEPTAKDIIKIKNADAFIYVGGELEEWADRIVENLDDSKKAICLLDMADLIKETEVDGAEHVHEHEEFEGANEVELEYDSHVWTSPANSIKIVRNLANLICDLDEENEEEYSQNAEEYIAQIKNVQNEIQKIVDNRVRDRLVFGDRMPMQYFINEFGLEVSAAFNGCSSDAEPSSKTISYLIDRVKSENIPVVLYIELGNGMVAQTIADETGSQIAQIQSFHNVSKDDFYNGETYVSLMIRNLEVLKKALL